MMRFQIKAYVIVKKMVSKSIEAYACAQFKRSIMQVLFECLTVEDIIELATNLNDIKRLLACLSVFVCF